MGAFELLLIDPDLRSLVARGGQSSDIREHVYGRGFRTLEEDALFKACCGLIAPEEVARLGLGIAASLAAMGASEDGRERGAGDEEEKIDMRWLM